MPLRAIQTKTFDRGVKDLKPSYLWLVERADDTIWYDEFSAIVVVADTEAEALAIKPYDPADEKPKEEARRWKSNFAGKEVPVELKATCIGLALPQFVSGQVIISDYQEG